MSGGQARRGTVAVAVAGCLVAAALASCAVEATVPPPRCDGPGSSLIVAQSVPTASRVPCFRGLPAGWEVDSVQVTQDGTVVTLDSDRVGSGAAVLRFAESCDVSGAVQSPSDQPAARRFDEIERLRPGFRAHRYYVFAGGCAWWTFDFAAGTSATAAVAVDGSLDLVSRTTLNEVVRRTFVDAPL